MKSTISEFLPLSIPHLAGNEWKYVKECLDTNWVSSVGSFVDKFEQSIADYTGATYAVATVNGTAALHICLQIAGVRRDNYVIIPNITFVASANAVSYTGATPLLMDVESDSWQMDLDLLEEFLENHTQIQDNHCVYKKDGRVIRAIMPVHVLGNMCDMDRLCQLAEAFKLWVVEDSTEALGSSQQGKHSGTFGHLGTFSFNGNKIITTGGGGMIVTDNEAWAKRAKHLTTTAKTDPIEYKHDEVGYNYRLVNILAALGVAQMEQLPAFLEKRASIAAIYQAELGHIDAISFQQVLPHVSPNNWLFTIRTPYKDVIFNQLKTRNIQARPLWQPMNKLPMFMKSPFFQRQDVSSLIHSQCLSLPSSGNLTEENILYVCDLIKSCL